MVRHIAASGRTRFPLSSDVRTFRSADVRVYPGQRLRCDQRLFPACDHHLSIGLGVERPEDQPRLGSVEIRSRPRLARPTASWPVPHAQSRTRELGGRDFSRLPDAATGVAALRALAGDISPQADLARSSILASIADDQHLTTAALRELAHPQAEFDLHLRGGPLCPWPTTAPARIGQAKFLARLSAAVNEVTKSLTGRQRLTPGLQLLAPSQGSVL